MLVLAEKLNVSGHILLYVLRYNLLTILRVLSVSSRILLCTPGRFTSRCTSTCPMCKWETWPRPLSGLHGVVRVRRPWGIDFRVCSISSLWDDTERCKRLGILRHCVILITKFNDTKSIKWHIITIYLVIDYLYYNILFCILKSLSWQLSVIYMFFRIVEILISLFTFNLSL